MVISNDTIETPPAVTAEGYLMQHCPRKMNKWQRRWFTLAYPAGILRCYPKHSGAGPGKETAQVELGTPPALVVATHTPEPIVPAEVLEQWRQMSEFDFMVVLGPGANLMLRAASTSERDSWVSLLQKATGQSATVPSGSPSGSDEALVSAALLCIPMGAGDSV
jgi:hypothetical protein